MAKRTRKMVPQESFHLYWVIFILYSWLFKRKNWSFIYIQKMN